MPEPRYMTLEEALADPKTAEAIRVACDGEWLEPVAAEPQMADLADEAYERWGDR